MKWMKAVACTALLALSGPAFCDEGQTESPRDYAFGLSLDTSVPSQWYRVMLPLAVYEQSTSPDLHDVRVFNQSGEAVPFSLVSATRPQVPAQSTALRLFPLDASPLAASRGSGDSDKILLRSGSGVEIVLEGQKAAAAGQHYLLTLPEQATGEIAISQLQLLWNTPQTPWQERRRSITARILSAGIPCARICHCWTSSAVRIVLSSIGSIPIPFYLPMQIAISWWC